jgi:putative DNA methylase
MPVRAALALINQVLDELVTDQEGGLDPESRWAVAWFEQFGFSTGPFGVAETLSKAKNVSMANLVDSGLVDAPSGRVGLRRPDQLGTPWNPGAARRLSIWEVTHRLSQVLETGGEIEAGELLRKVGGLADDARALAYRLYLVCERRKWPKEALSYNGLVVAWPELLRHSKDDAGATPLLPLLEA